MGVRIVTWNLHGSRLRDLEGVVAKLVEFDADVVCIQEIQRRQYRHLSGAVGPFGGWTFKHWPIRIRAEGLAVMARLPIAEFQSFVISRMRPWWSWRRRVAQSIVVESESGLVRIVNTHLGADVPDRVRAQQARCILERTGLVDLVVGDLNVTPTSDVLAEFEPCIDAWTRRHPDEPHPPTNWHPGERNEAPGKRLDFVLVAPEFDVIEVQIPRRWESWALLSDHLPVVVDVAVRSPKF